MAREIHPVWQVLAGVVLFVVAQLSIGLVTVSLRWAAWGSGLKDEPPQGFSPLKISGAADSISLLGGVCVGVLIAVFGYRFILRKIGKRPAIELLGPSAWRELGWGMALGAVLVSIPIGILAALGMYRINGFGLSWAIALCTRLPVTRRKLKTSASWPMALP